MTAWFGEIMERKEALKPFFYHFRPFHGQRRTIRAILPWGAHFKNINVTFLTKSEMI